MSEEEKAKDEKAKHQNDFINQRLTWLGTFSSLLFIANGFGKYPVLIPIVGFGIAMSIWVGTSAANSELNKLGRKRHTMAQTSYAGCLYTPVIWVRVGGNHSPAFQMQIIANTGKAGVTLSHPLLYYMARTKVECSVPYCCPQPRPE